MRALVARRMPIGIVLGRATGTGSQSQPIVQSLTPVEKAGAWTGLNHRNVMFGRSERRYARGDCNSCCGCWQSLSLAHARKRKAPARMSARLSLARQGKRGAGLRAFKRTPRVVPRASRVQTRARNAFAVMARRYVFQPAPSVVAVDPAARAAGAVSCARAASNVSLAMPAVSDGSRRPR